MNKLLIRLLCLFVPISAWRKAIRRNSKLQEKRRIQVKKFNKIANWKTGEIDNVRVASAILENGKSLRLGHLFGKDLTPLGVANSVLKMGEYHFAVEGKSVVIDIGMNVGIASLYFAMRDDVSRVYGYEPVPATHEKALFNFSINDSYSDIITPINCGLGDSRKSMSIKFKEWHSGGASMIANHNKGENVAVQVLDAAAEFGKILGKHRGQQIVVKCDAEGAEKEIFARLDEVGRLADIDIIIMEYHFGYDEFVEHVLIRNGFALFKTEQNAGLIRAVNKNKNPYRTQ